MGVVVVMVVMVVAVGVQDVAVDALLVSRCLPSRVVCFCVAYDTPCLTPPHLECQSRADQVKSHQG